MNQIKRLINDEEGQGLVEYALIVGLIALVCVAAITISGTSISNLWNSIAGRLDATSTKVNGVTITP